MQPWPVCSVVVILLAASMAIEPVHGSNPTLPKENRRVKELFASMRSEKYSGIEFPKLDWSDITALLDHADETNQLRSFPRDAASSQYEPHCSEGMVALWLIEGIRRGDRYPSGNALCFNAAKAGNDWGKASEANHKQVAKAYRAWWEKARSLPSKEAKKLDPLQGADLAWH
ncbi:MAG TPA: DUF4943 family protein [Pirellulales bacterium]|nr:DUF4943 family protein [Pirellulales bacterium]